MLKLTKKSDYGLIALQHFTLHAGGESASAKKIAELYSIPLPLLSKILQKLARSGFLAASAGAAGGYRLARDPRRISALEVVRSLEGPVLTTQCRSGAGACERQKFCTVREPLGKVNGRIIQLLESITLAELVARGEEPALPDPSRQAKMGAGGNRQRL